MSNLGWAVKNGDLDLVKEFIENKVSFWLQKNIETEKTPYLLWFCYCVLHHVPFLFVGGCVFLIAFKKLDDYSLGYIVLNICNVINEYLTFGYLFQGMNVNADIDGRSPLHYAADYGQIEVLQYLVSKGANGNAKDKHGISVLLAAIWEGHTNCVKFLIQKVLFKLQ